MTAQPLAVPITADPWGEAKDLEELHAEATQAIIRSVTELRSLAGRGDAGAGRPKPLLILGTAGIGKTHLFSRLRRKLGRQAILVHIRPITSADMSPRYVLGQVLQQLARTSGGSRQLDSLVGSMLSLGLDGDPNDSAVGLDLLRSLDARGRKENLEHFLSRLLEKMPDLDDGYLELLLNAPFLEALPLRASLAWLGGQDVSETQAARIGVQKPLADDRVLPALRTVARMASPSAPLVVVFDQLENLIQDAEQGRILAYGNLMMDLVDDVKDLVIVQMALETEWDRGFRPALSLAQQARVIGSVFTLQLPSPRGAEDLIRLWMSDYPSPPACFPWPFTAQEIEHLTTQNATPRMLLQELQRSLEGSLPLVEHEKDTGATLLAQAWEEGLQRARGEMDERDPLEQGATPEALADGLIHLVRLVPELALVSSQGPERLHIKTPQGDLCVALIHQSHHRSIASALDRLGTASGRKLGLREDWRPFRPTWKVTRGRWEALRQRPEVGWHWLTRKDAEGLLALDGMLKAAVSRDLSGPGGIPFEPSQVEDWVRQVVAPQGWAIAQALRVGSSAWSGDAREQEVTTPVLGSPRGWGESVATGTGFRREPDSLTLRKLRQLRVASVDRLVRECRQEGRDITRSALLTELRTAGASVIWIGDTIVCMER